MKYLGMALFLFVPIQFVYMMLTEAYKNFGIKLEKLQLAMKLYRYALAVGCLIAALFWQGAEPPILDMSKVQTTEGIVECKNSGGKGRSSGMHKMDGIFYKEAFSYVFGTGPDEGCFEELNNRKVKILWLPIYDNKERLLLQISDKDTNRIYGLTMDNKYERYKESISNKAGLYVLKIALFLLAIQFGFWERANKFHRLGEFTSKTTN